MICPDGAAEARIRTDFGSICDRFTFEPADTRYSAPGMAMVALDWTRRDGNDSPFDLVVPFPTRRSDLIIRDATPAVAREEVERLMGWRVSRELLSDLQFVASEVVTNAVVHEASPTVFEVWHEADGCALRVTDHGPGGVDRYAHLRPLQGEQHGGFGLFTVGQLTDSVEFTRHDNTTVVSVYIALR